MSSMVRKSASILLPLLTMLSVPAACEDGSEWDQARSQLIASQRGSMTQAIDRWRLLTSSDRFAFSDYASFLLAYPGFPDEAKLRINAERALDRESADAARRVAFFDRLPPVTNPARAQYALALAALQRPEAQSVALTAWRGGAMSDGAEAAIFAQFDHDARMNALLWAGATAQAERQILYVSPPARNTLMARLAALQGSDPTSLGIVLGSDVLRDTGYVYNRVRQLRRSGQSYAAANLLATRPQASVIPLDQSKWVDELLTVAKAADPASAVRIAASIDDAFPAGTDVSRLNFGLRDDYTSLMWLGAMRALVSSGEPARAAPLFYRYGAAARTPQTRSKGFFWAGKSLIRAGDMAGANRYFEMAGLYADQFYGMLALERLGRPLPNFHMMPSGTATPDERAAFRASPLTTAVREVARESDWPTTIRFFREICDQAQSEGDHVLVADLARELGRRDLGVILGQAAHTDGFGNFHDISFPLIPIPPGASWTMVHAITRQESQFSMNAISHAGARGLMQLMPGTAREEAGKQGLAYDPTGLTRDAGYNLTLGNGYFARMLNYYNGSYPLAVAAYNAGPGNVNRWLRNNGDPRNGGIDWIDWIEKIPLTETRGYVQHVIENAVVYEAMNPARATYTGSNPLSHFLGKNVPG